MLNANFLMFNLFQKSFVILLDVNLCVFYYLKEGVL